LAPLPLGLLSQVLQARDELLNLHLELAPASVDLLDQRPDLPFVKLEAVDIPDHVTEAEKLRQPFGELPGEDPRAGRISAARVRKERSSRMEGQPLFLDPAAEQRRALGEELEVHRQGDLAGGSASARKNLLGGSPSTARSMSRGGPEPAPGQGAEEDHPGDAVALDEDTRRAPGLLHRRSAPRLVSLPLRRQAPAPRLHVRRVAFPAASVAEGREVP
jgi:hypothetical protein